MSLCSHNLKVGILSDGTLVKVENNTLTGPVGKLYNRFFFSEDTRNCSYRPMSTTTESMRAEESERNSTWFSLWRNDLLDLFFVKRKLQAASDNLIVATKIVGTTSLQAGQFLKPKTENSDSLHFLISNLRLLVLIILGFFLVAATTTILTKLSHEHTRSPWKSLKLVLFKVLFVDHNRLPRIHLKPMFLMLHLFLFFNLNFLGNTITTESIVVPTNEIVDCAPKLVATRKTLALDSEELDFLKNAPEGSFLRKLSKKTILPVGGLSDLVKMKTKGIDSYLIFAVGDGLLYFMALVSEHANQIGAVAFIKSTRYYESLSVFAMRRRLDETRKRFINSRMEASLENGFLLALTSKLDDFLMLNVKKQLKIYHTIEDFVEDVTQTASPDVKLENMQNLFFYFVLCLVFVSLVFVTDIFLFEHLKTFTQRIVICF